MQILRVRNENKLGIILIRFLHNDLKLEPQKTSVISLPRSIKKVRHKNELMLVAKSVTNYVVTKWASA